MHTPTKQQVQKVIDNFSRVLHMAQHEGALCMYEGSITAKNRCGTTSCHGGWYAIACYDEVRRLNPHVTTIDWVEGSDLIGIHLGFEDSADVENWASINPGLWGNNNGDIMFDSSGELAFISESRPNGANTLADIVQHWCEVRDRLPI